MEGHLMGWGVSIAIVFDVAMIAWARRAITQVMERSAQAGAAHAACDLRVDCDDGPIESSSDDHYSHGPLTNPATGLPMLGGAWMDVAGNPYGTDLNTHFESSLNGIGSSSFGAGLSGLHDG